ncbi:MAG: hypothetical protein MI742_09025 [Desulfobacterales bacterium]|nr:hypothetical protein [Desulfobacterales bacterium]
MKLSDIAKVLDATLLAGDIGLGREFSLCRASDLMSDLLTADAVGGVFLTGLTTLQAVRTAVVSGVGVLVFVRGKEPPEEVVALAESEEVPVLTTPYSMFVSCGRLYSSGMAGQGADR